ncbi:ArsR family transcriptional regulator [Candidatus Kryptobacter tengchongensis]|uniref:ArsR family transcriptional regulator n=1 Tax=Kryptobacter tengchongensis TaxID=1643429 RepID=A0A656CX69_KRYT1|nr:metalloregulator ArsR/SmtB family transcription factor [Candidatus Kryptobacter tengchongensis]CUS76638.1 ArsR family transcriptional regulator [Candidatus Kryptobacter tengchongensis]CUT05279.1 ArsR family transcriptional regulator [Candidatus Kryptobacter tengchongensis]CUU09895.1 ArsR family transcriptional regulator [Candidatus Kryptobacter tengchongensis]
MLGEKINEFSQIAEILRILGNPTRLKIISELIDSDKTVSELWHLVGISQSLVSQHLAVLRRSGIIKSVRRGNTVYYSVANPLVVKILKLTKNKLKQMRD